MQLINEDSLVALHHLPDNSVDLVVTDPPYYKVLGDDWDNQWKSEQAFLDWCESILTEFRRVLKPNGSLYWFAGPPMAGKLEVLVSQYFNVLNHIVWVKPSGRFQRAKKSVLRKFFTQSERLIFAEPKDSEKEYEAQSHQQQKTLYAPIVDYLNDLRKKAGFTVQQCIDICGTSSASHYFQKSQFMFPNEQQFRKLITAFTASADEVELRSKFELLRQDYNQLKKQYEATRRPFQVSSDIPFTDVWHFDIVQPGKRGHPAQKPLALMEHILHCSSKPGAVVLDAFMGSGSTGVASLNANCEFIGIDSSPEHFEQAKNRLLNHWHFEQRIAA